MATPDERREIENRLTSLKIRMDSLDHFNRPENLGEWTALYELRQVLEELLGGENDGA